MRIIGVADFFKRKDVQFSFDLDLLQDIESNVYAKRMAFETCIEMIARTISQSEFRIKDKKKFIKDTMYYKLNVKPNRNQSSADFWQKVVHKLIFDNECLIIKSDSEELLIADDYDRTEYTFYDDTFKNVTVKDITFKRVFRMSDVIFFEYQNEEMSKLVDGLFADYGKLMSQLFVNQRMQNQIRSSIDIDSNWAKTDEDQEKIESFIKKVYKTIETKVVALFPQQKGLAYNEHSKSVGNKQSVDEIQKLYDGFLSQIARAVGIPWALLKGDMSDVEKPTRNYMTFCIDPLLNKVSSELNGKFFTEKEFLNGQMIDVKRISYSNLFDNATSIDKLIGSGAFTPNEVREEAGKERSDDPNMDVHYITKNYEKAESNSLEGGE